MGHHCEHHCRFDNVIGAGQLTTWSTVLTAVALCVFDADDTPIGYDHFNPLTDDLGC